MGRLQAGKPRSSIAPLAAMFEQQIPRKSLRIYLGGHALWKVGSLALRTHAFQKEKPSSHWRPRLARRQPRLAALKEKASSLGGGQLTAESSHARRRGSNKLGSMT